MVISKQEKNQTSKNDKTMTSTSATRTTSSSSMSKTTSSTSSTSKTTSEHKTSEQQLTGGQQQSSVVISEVHDTSSGSLDDRAVRAMQTKYVVTPPELAPQPPKEHYIFGGTQIVEMGTTMGSDLISREKNQNAWNGKFVYESTPQRTVLKSWTTQSSNSNPADPSTSITTTTTEEIVKTGPKPTTMPRTTKAADASKLSTPSSKLVSDTVKQQTGTNVSSSTTTSKNFDVKSSKDVTDLASATDQLLESERCIAKKAYVTTDETDKTTTSTTKTTATTSDIESQILGNKSVFDNTTTTKKSGETRTSDRYPIATLPQTSQGTKTINTEHSMSKFGDKSNRTTTELNSQSYSTSTRSEKASSSSKMIEIVDGKERVISDDFHETGSMQTKSSQEKYSSLQPSAGSKPHIEYDQRTAEENITYGTDKRDKEPIYDRNYSDVQRSIRQSGDNRPVEHSKGSYETTRYDEKTKKYVTDTRHHDHNRPLNSTVPYGDSIQSKYDVETSHLNIDKQTSKTNQLTDRRNDDVINRSRSTIRSTTDDSATTKTTRDNRTTATDNKTKSNRTTANDFTSTQTTSDDSITTTQTDSFDTKTTAYTSKVFDSKTNTWKTVDASKTSATNAYSNAPKPNSRAGSKSPTKQPDTKGNQTNLTKDKRTTASTTSIDSHSTRDSKTDTSRKNVHDTKTTVDRKTRTDTITKTRDEKISQHLYDEKTKTWREVDEKTIKSKRPSLIRYVSKDNDGKFTTIYKRKLFDKRSGTWKVVDEKVYRNNHFNEHIPEVIEDETNITTTTYTTKVFDTKTNTWRIVDEQTFTDHNTQVPKDIADEIARDQADVANITTTTELTKVSRDVCCVFLVQGNYRIFSSISL